MEVRDTRSIVSQFGTVSRNGSPLPTLACLRGPRLHLALSQNKLLARLIKRVGLCSPRAIPSHTGPPLSDLLLLHVWSGKSGKRGPRSQPEVTKRQVERGHALSCCSPWAKSIGAVVSSCRRHCVAKSSQIASVIFKSKSRRATHVRSI